MAIPTFPSFIGIGFPVHRSEIWKSTVQEAWSGRETQIQNWSFPRHKWEAQFNVLRNAAAFNELQTMLAFVDSIAGAGQPFYYADPDDSTVTGQSLGTGNGTITAFQLERTFTGTGGISYTEAIANINGTPVIYVGGLPEPQALPPPAAPTLSAVPPPAAPALSSVAGGALAAATYFAKVTYVTAGGETGPSAEASLAVAINNLLVVTSPAVQAGATGYNVYVSKTTGTETKQNTTPIAIGTNWTEPTTGLVAGAAPPTPLAAVTYFAKVSYLTPNGETLPSAEASLAVALGSLLIVASPATATDAIGYNAYVSTTTGTETKQNAAAVAIGTAWPEPTTGLISGVAPLAASTVGWTLAANPSGLVTFTKAPANGAAITADFSYFFLCRLTEDNIALSKFASGFFELSKLSWISLK